MEDHSIGNHQESKRLERASGDRKLGGVCQGIAKYFEIDAVYVMFGFVALTMFGFFFVPIIYLILWLVLPAEGEVDQPISERVQANLVEVREKLTEIFEKAKAQVMSLGLTN